MRLLRGRVGGVGSIETDAKGLGFYFWGDENILKLDCTDGHTTL